MKSLFEESNKINKEFRKSRMKHSSAKAKGRNFQQFVRDVLLKYAPSLLPDDIRSTSMGAGGEDILFSPAARKIYPFSVECKRVEKLNVYEAIKQCEKNSQGYTPLVVFRQNGMKAYAALPLDDLMKLIGEPNTDDF